MKTDISNREERLKMKKKLIFKGVGTALVTPFRDGEIDYSSLDKLIEWQITSGVDALVIGGTTGEAATLSEVERYTLYEHAVRIIDGRCKVMLGCGTNDTRVALSHTQFAESLGCDGALHVTPYYNKGTEEGVYRHYALIAEASSLPIMLYNVPQRTGVNLGVNLLSRLAEYENIVGIKEASDSFLRMSTLASFGERLPLYAGNDSGIYPTLALGGVGVVSVASNVIPCQIKRLTEMYFSGELTESLKLQCELLPFINSLFAETNPTPVKYAMEKLSLAPSDVRLPLYDARDSTKQAIDDELSRLSELGYLC